MDSRQAKPVIAISPPRSINGVVGPLWKSARQQNALLTLVFCNEGPEENVGMVFLYGMVWCSCRLLGELAIALSMEPLS